MIDFNPARVAYTVLHQRRQDVDEEAYTARFLALHRAVRDAARRFASDAALPASGPLAHALGLDQLGRVESAETRSVALTAATDEARAALERGRAYTESLRFQSDAAIHESRFFVTGSVHLDVLEHLVRDHLGIYRPPHDGVINAFRAATFNVFNQVFALTPERAEAEPEPAELVMLFNKPGRPGEVQYEDFREGLRTWMERLVEHQEVSAELWQRKLGLGRLREFALRVRGADADALLRHATDHAAAPAVAQALLEQSALLAFQFVGP